MLRSARRFWIVRSLRIRTESRRPKVDPVYIMLAVSYLYPYGYGVHGFRYEYQKIYPRVTRGVPYGPPFFPSNCLPWLLTLSPCHSTTTPQDDQLTLRLASVCTLQVIWVALVWHLSGLCFCLVAHLRGGLLGLTLGFYRAQVRYLDVAHFDCHLNCKISWGQPRMARALSGHTSPASPSP